MSSWGTGIGSHSEKINEVFFRCCGASHTSDCFDWHTLTVVINAGVNGSIRKQVGHHQQSVGEPQVKVQITVFVVNCNVWTYREIIGGLYDAGGHRDDTSGRVHSFDPLRELVDYGV